MINLLELEKKLESICPLEISKAFIEKGHYDNSGAIIKQNDKVSKILFALDINKRVVEKALDENFDTIITHHPAIYQPVKSLDIETIQGEVLLKAIKGGLNVYSMHLNLDGATGGIDDSLAMGLGAKKSVVIDKVYGKNGYGKEFNVEKQSFGDYVKKVAVTFETERIIYYGDEKMPVTKVASFCGGGSDDALLYNGSADVIVTSDMPHHVITQIVEKGKGLILLTHYASEIYGFKVFFEKMKTMLLGTCECHLFEDVRYK